MCEAGRILHHLRNNIEDPRNTILITGFQAENTLGRKLWISGRRFPSSGEPMRVRAEIRQAERIERPRRPEGAAQLVEARNALFEEDSSWCTVSHRNRPHCKEAISERFHVAAVVPSRGESFELE